LPPPASPAQTFAVLDAERTRARQQAASASELQRELALARGEAAALRHEGERLRQFEAQHAALLAQAQQADRVDAVVAELKEGHNRKVAQMREAHEAAVARLSQQYSAGQAEAARAHGIEVERARLEAAATAGDQIKRLQVGLSRPAWPRPCASAERALPRPPLLRRRHSPPYLLAFLSFLPPSLPYPPSNSQSPPWLQDELSRVRHALEAAEAARDRAASDVQQDARRALSLQSSQASTSIAHLEALMHSERAQAARALEDLRAEAAAAAGAMA
jgi:hypothetical protein